MFRFTTGRIFYEIWYLIFSQKSVVYPTLYFPTNAHNVKKRIVIKTF